MASTPMMFLTFVASVALTSGSEFLKAQQNEHVSEDSIRATFIAEVEATLGTGSATNRVRLVEAILKPMYIALPKNEHGKLGHSTVRYALHRLFVMLHGWHVRGLARDANISSITSPAGVLKGQVPAYIQDLFEKRLGNKGLGLQELAVMAATMERLIHQEAVGKLGEAYRLSGISPTEEIDLQATDHVLAKYVMAYILEEDLSQLNARQAGLLMAKMPVLFSAWNDTMAFLGRLRSNITGDPSSFNFSILANVAEGVGEQYGTFQDIECREMKSFLMEREFRGSGRLKLADFWKPTLEGDSPWHFRESVGYLRQLGALDESDPNDMTVVIPNYLHSHTNCVARSAYYAVCCKDECEGLFGQLEEKIAAPETFPSTLARIIEDLPSSTVKSPRKLPTTLRRRLEDIAAEHGGMVPLHGRLFAQWMHHAYPRECPYPHQSGTVTQQKGSEFAKQTGIKQFVSEEDMDEYMSLATNSTMDGDDEAVLPWSPAEELLVERSTPMKTASSFPTRLRPVVLMALSASLAFALVQSFEKIRVSADPGANAKFIV